MRYCGSRSMALIQVLLLAVLAAAPANKPAASPAKPCTVLPPDAKPIIEVAGKGSRSPLGF